MSADSTKTKPPGPPPRGDSLDETGPSSNRALKDAARRAVQEHDVLRRKYSKKEEQTKLLVEELEQTKEILQQLESVSGQVIQEYSDVQNKLDIETQCRQEAEKYATKTVREIKELKRKSQMVFQQNGIDFSKIVDISLDDDPEESSLDDGEEEGPLAKELEVQIEHLKNQLLKSKKDLSYAMEERDACRDDLNGAYYQVSQLKEELKHETMAHERTKKALQERDNIINQLKRVSALVYDEFNEVQTLYQKESAMREQAEILASQYYAKNKESEAFKRQSAMLLSDAISGDTKLLESLTEVERLTKEMEEEREKHKMEVKRVKDELELSEDREKMMMMENKLSIAKEENESLEKRVGELETRTKELAYDLKEAQKQPSLPNIPPPPPPPPMPILPKNPLEMLQKMLGRKQPKASVQTRHLDSYQKQFESAMQDMVIRIKKGQVKLRPTKINDKSPDDTSPTKPGATQAVQELDSILMNLKNRKNNRPKVLPKGTSVTEPDSQFRELMEKRRLRSTPTQPPPVSPKPVAKKKKKKKSTWIKKLTSSTSLDSGILPNQTNVPPPVSTRQTPLSPTASDPLPPPGPAPIYSTVHQEPPLSPPSTPSSTLSSIISSTSSQEIEIQNNPAFIHDSGDERTYASADFPSPTDRPSVNTLPWPSRQANMSLESKFQIGDDMGEYSLVKEKPQSPRPAPVPSPRRRPSEPTREPEPYYSEVNI